MTFTFHRPPLKHQLEGFNRFKDKPFHGLFWEQRCRKTWVELNIFRYRYLRGDVTALVVIAHPNGVHRVWIDELEYDFPPEFLSKAKYFAWSRRAVGTKAGQETLDELLVHSGPVILTLNCDSITTPKALKYLRRFFRKHKVMLVADESSWAARFSARTRKLLQIGRSNNAIVKAILDGTPASEGPTDLYYPTQFLRPELLGFSTREAFKNRYIAYEQEEEPGNPGTFRRKKGFNRRTNTEFDIIVGTQNLEELHGKLNAFSSRVRRADISDAPPKTYQTRYFDLSPKMRAVYDKLRKEYIVELSSGVMPVAEVLKRMTRLQMVSRNYYPPEKVGLTCPHCAYGYLDTGDECEACDGLGIIVKATDFERIDTENPALEALIAELAATPAPAVVWCKFRQDSLDCSEAILNAGRPVLRYDGSIKESEREAAYQTFRTGTDPQQVIVATLASGLTRGRDLTRAELLIYYSNDFSLRIRQQSEDRAESLVRKISTDIVDLVAADTRDIDIVKAHREKQSISDIILGDAIALL